MLGRQCHVTSTRRFRFGADCHYSLGSFIMIVPTPGGFLFAQADVNGTAPFLLGLDSMDHHRLQAFTVFKVLQYVPVDNSDTKSWRIDLQLILSSVFYLQLLLYSD